MTTIKVNPRRGDVWLVDFDPSVGDEIRKCRPAVVVSSNSVGRLRLKLVAPVTEWKDQYAYDVWHVRLDPDGRNGLTKTSAVDALQLHSVDHQRLVRRLGRLTPLTMEEIAAAIAIVVEYR